MIRITTDKNDKERVLTKISKATSYKEMIVGAATLIEVLVKNECASLEDIFKDIERMIERDKGEN